MPKSVSYLPSQRSATSAKALTTWLPAAQSKHNSLHRVLRENCSPPKKTRRSTASRHHLPRPLIKHRIRLWGSTEANQTALMEWRETQSPSTCWSCFWNYLRLKILMKNVAEVFFLIWFLFGVTLRNTAVLLHSGRLLNVWITGIGDWRL